MASAVPHRLSKMASSSSIDLDVCSGGFIRLSTGAELALDGVPHLSFALVLSALLAGLEMGWADCRNRRFLSVRCAESDVDGLD